jgi:hypothetical protein
MLRLELGQSTANVAVETRMSLDQTINIFKELQEKDKVFEYPSLTDETKAGPDGGN